MVTLPRTPPEQLAITEADLVDWIGPAVRIHGTAGPHATAWHQLRHFGPLPARFDPHPPPTGTHPDVAVMYIAGELATALAEVFQTARTVLTQAANVPYLTVWRPRRRLRLLDVTGPWPLRNGASRVLNTGPHAVCRSWARAIAAHKIRVDGLRYTSSMTGSPAGALFLPAADSFPDAPELSIPLSHPGLVHTLQATAERIGYGLEY